MGVCLRLLIEAWIEGFFVQHCSTSSNWATKRESLEESDLCSSYFLPHQTMQKRCPFVRLYNCKYFRTSITMVMFILRNWTWVNNDTIFALAIVNPERCGASWRRQKWWKWKQGFSGKWTCVPILLVASGILMAFLIFCKWIWWLFASKLRLEIKNYENRGEQVALNQNCLTNSNCRLQAQIS